jgi:hypothetical protein
MIGEWRTKYNKFRPHSASGYKTLFDSALAGSGSVAVYSLDNTGAKPGQGSPHGLASSALTRPGTRAKGN